jgi:hypothetical protein
MLNKIIDYKMSKILRGPQQNIKEGSLEGLISFDEAIKRAVRVENYL